MQDGTMIMLVIMQISVMLTFSASCVFLYTVCRLLKEHRAQRGKSKAKSKPATAAGK